MIQQPRDGEGLPFGHLDRRRHGALVHDGDARTLDHQRTGEVQVRHLGRELESNAAIAQDNRGEVQANAELLIFDGDRRSAADVTMRADAHELVHGAERCQYRILLDDDVSGESSAVYEHGVIADLAVVSDMRVGHDERVVANAGSPATFFRAAADGH